MEHLGVDWSEVQQQGFTVVRGAVPLDVCHRARALMDAQLGPPGESCKDHVAKLYGGVQDDRAWTKKAAAWPAAVGVAAWDGIGPRPPEIATGGFRHSLRHPIRDSVMADLVTPAMVQIHKRLLRTESLRMNQQFMVRTDYQPGPYPEVPGWHLDHAFLPHQWEATPSAVYYSSM